MKFRFAFTITVMSVLFNCVVSYSQPASVSAEKPFHGVPDRQDVIIYQVNIRAFSETGDLKGVIPRLDSIKALGANVVYLMPTYPVGKVKSVNSPYCIRDYVSVNEEFGTLNDLRLLVNTAHEKGLSVILDWVANHTAFDHPWTSNPTWYLQDSTGKILSPPGMGWNDVAQLNFKNPDMRLAMIRAMKYWVETANIDGFRCDYADGPPVDFWKQANDTLRAITDHKLLMLAEGSRPEHFAAGFDFNFGFRFFERLKDIYEHKRSVLSIDSLNLSDYKGVVDGTQSMVRYTTNHDVNGSDGTPQELFGGQRGAMAAFVVAAYMKSIPMVYNGEEVGTPYRLVFPFTEKNIDWSLNPMVTAEYKKILAVRNNSKAIRRGRLASFSNEDVCVFTKQQENETVLVIVNLRNNAVDYAIPQALNMAWSDVFTAKKKKLSGKIKLAPYSYEVLTKQT
ncbi:MAG: alpha-glucosidase C-terminal domain-containing protein, partial [Chitinophagaceae bacterium]|nr:alpha-glucosidase C-terminal domain-containing protein [Chitinophagaceae bacterium]